FLLHVAVNWEQIGGADVREVCAVSNSVGVPGTDRPAAAAAGWYRSQAYRSVQRRATVAGPDTALGSGRPALGSGALGLGAVLGEGQAPAGDQCPGRDGSHR